MTVVDILFFLFAAIYVVLILHIVYGWYRLKEYHCLESVASTEVAVVVAFKDEEKNVISLIKSFENQSYPNQLIEYIFIDDHSEDNSYQLLFEQIEGKKNFKLYKLPDNEKGKKAALQYGINKAKYDVIITTDADCFMSTDWIKSMLLYYQEYKPMLLSGPVSICADSSFFSQLQSIEFASLIGSGAGAIGISRPIMCNAANLLFEKELYNSCSLGKKQASGDDIFLMLHAKSINKTAVHFVKSRKAIVKTKASESVLEFFNQRARWVSKSKAYRDFDILFVAFSVGIVNLLICLGLMFAYNYISFLVLFISKFLVDFILLSAITKFLNIRKFLQWFVLLQIVYPFYVIVSAFQGLLGNFNWKSRKFT